MEPGIRYIGPRHIIRDNVNPVPVPFWEFNRIYQDKTIVIIGGGPSHIDIDLNLLHNINFCTVNSSCRKVKEIVKEEDILYFTDNSWSERFEDLVREWKGLVVTSNRNTKARLGNLVNRIDIVKLTEFMEIKSDYVQASSGHSAACLAVMLGAKRLCLVGFECQEIEGRTHGHDDYRQSDLNTFKRFLKGWTALKIGFEDKGIEVFNCTTNSRIEEFEYRSLEDALTTSL